MAQVARFNLLEALGQNEADVVKVEYLVRNSEEERDMVLVYKRVGYGRLFLLAYEVRRTDIVVEYLIKSIAPCFPNAVN